MYSTRAVEQGERPPAARAAAPAERAAHARAAASIRAGPGFDPETTVVGDFTKDTLTCAYMATELRLHWFPHRQSARRGAEPLTDGRGRALVVPGRPPLARA